MKSSLYETIASGDIVRLNQLIDLGDKPLLLQMTPLNNTCLHVAVQFAEKVCVEEICKRYPSLLKQQNMEGDTPLHIAARLGESVIAAFLIHHAKLIEQKEEEEEKSLRNRGNYYGYSSKTMSVQGLVRMENQKRDTALHEAVRNGRFEAVKLLTEADPAFEYFANNAGETPLYLAVKNKYDSCVEQILKICPSSAHGAPGRRTALHAAALDDYINPDIIKLLLEKKPQMIKETDMNRRSALHYAVFSGNKEMVAQLMDVDPSVAYMLDDYGMTALHHAAAIATTTTTPTTSSDKNSTKNTNSLIVEDIDVIKMVIERCPDCWELVDNKGQSFLHVATENGRLYMIKYIAEMKPKIMKNLKNCRDKYGNKPVHLALKFNHYDCYEILREDSNDGVLVPFPSYEDKFIFYDTAQHTRRTRREGLENRRESNLISSDPFQDM